MKNKKSLLLLLSVVLYSSQILASSSVSLLDGYEVSVEQESLKKGATIYYNLCRMCHSLKYIKYQHLLEIGFNEAEVNALRQEHLMNKAIVSTATPENAMKMFGMVPPDLSIMAKARKHGPEYIYSLMLSYVENSEGIYENKIFNGIKMPDVFSYSIAQGEQEKQKIQKDAADVASFLTWTSDPHASDRKTMGFYVIAYLLVLSGLMYLVMRRVWRRLD